MQRKRGETVPIGDALSDLDGPVKPIRVASPQERQVTGRLEELMYEIKVADRAVQGGTKNTPNLAPQTGSANRVARNVE